MHSIDNPHTTRFSLHTSAPTQFAHTACAFHQVARFGVSRQVIETTVTAQEKVGSKKAIEFKHTIIAAGLQAAHLPFVRDSARMVNSTGALALFNGKQNTLDAYRQEQGGA